MMAALVLMIGAAVLLIFVVPNQTTEGWEGEFSQAFLPNAAAVLILGASAVLLIRSVLTTRRDGGTADNDNASADQTFWIVCGLGTCGFVLALVLLDRAGFLLGGGAVITAFGMAFSHQHKLQIAILAVAFPPLMAVLIRHGLGLVLP